MDNLRETYQFLEKHGLGVEETATRGEARLEVPVCGFISGADGRMHKEMVSVKSALLEAQWKLSFGGLNTHAHMLAQFS